MNLTDFAWFAKKEFSLGVPVKCRDNRKVQALLFIFKELKKHITFTYSKRICELHITDDDKRNDHRSVFCFPIRRMKKDALKLKSTCEFISFNNKFFSEMGFVDPFSVDFLNIMNKMSHPFHLPKQTQKHRVPFSTVRRCNNKIFLAYDSSYKFQGFVKINVRKHGANYCTSASAIMLQSKYVDLNHLSKKLSKENSPKRMPLGQNLHTIHTW